MTMDDSDSDVDIESEELVIGKPIMTRSGQDLMFRRAQNGKPGHTNLLIKALRFISSYCHLQTNKQTNKHVHYVLIHYVQTNVNHFHLIDP